MLTGPWAEIAVCASADPEAFFPADGASNRDAKRICFGRPVRAKCLAYALEHNEAGIWGGLSETERRALRRGRPMPRQRRIPGTTGPLQPPTPGPRCGTEAGTKAHSRRGESSCRACVQAATQARRDRIEARA